MLATVLLSLAGIYPAAAVAAVVFAFPMIVIIAAGIILAILSATLAPDPDNRVSIE